MQRPLTREDLLSHGPLQRLGGQIFVLDEVDSTNAFLLQRIGAAEDGALAVAEVQTAGRGRQGRAWLAPRGSSVLLSALLLEPPTSPLLSGAALAAALAACEAIEQTTDCRPGLRWPNDLVVSGRKLSGVLAETTPLPNGAPGHRALAVGVGLNCLQQRGHFPVELMTRATSLELESAAPIDRAAIAGALVAALDRLVIDAADGRDGWARVMRTWKTRCGDIGARTTLECDGRRVSGTILDIADDGDLFVQLDQGGRQRFGAATTTRLW